MKYRDFSLVKYTRTRVHVIQEKIRPQIAYFYCSRIRIVIYLQKLRDFHFVTNQSCRPRVEITSINHRAQSNTLEKTAKECSSLWNTPSWTLSRARQIPDRRERRTKNEAAAQVPGCRYFRPLLKRAPTPDYRPRRDWVFVRNKWPLMVFLVRVSADNARSMARLALNPRAASQTSSRHCLVNDPTF